MTDQVRRSSRSVCSNIAEAWGKRRYIAAFKAKLNDAEAEAEAYETEVWMDLALRCGYIGCSQRDQVCEHYDALIKSLSGMIHNAERWCERP